MASETQRDPDRIYLEPAPYSPEGRLWCEGDVWPLPDRDDDRPGVEYIRVDLHAAEIARLTRELEEARERERRNLRLAYEEGWRDRHGRGDEGRTHSQAIEPALRYDWHYSDTRRTLDMAATPQEASDGTTRWHCEYGCGCVLDSRAARYHDCRRPASEEARKRVRHYLETELLLVREVLYIGSPHTRISTTIRSDQWDRWLDSHAAAIAALLSGTPRQEASDADT